jgi:endopolyphosphatase
MRGDLDPGTEQLLWLEQQLLLAKARGMQVYITGHVPASKGNWYEGCWGRYTELLGEYGGTVLG